MRKHPNVWDCKNMLWAKWESFYELEDTSFMKEVSWEQFAKDTLPSDVNEFTLECALEKFSFELKFVMRQPKDTMMYLFGEHAMLYDVFGCKEHRFVCTTHDDYPRYVPGMTVFCPECNKGIFFKEQRQAYEQIVDGEYVDEEHWKSIMKLSKIHKKFNREQNFKYHLNEWTKPNYILYRIKKALGFYNKKKEA